MFIDTEASADLKPTIVNAIIASRPIGWISSINAAGRVNLAPFSHFSIVPASPPVLIFLCNSAEDRRHEESLADFRATGEFVLNLGSGGRREAINSPAPHGVDVCEPAHSDKAASVKVRAPRVVPSPANLECRVLRIVEITAETTEEAATNVVFGRIVGVHIQEQFLDQIGCFDSSPRDENIRKFSDRSPKRRYLMDAWAAYCKPRKSGNVVAIHGKWRRTLS